MTFKTIKTRVILMTQEEKDAFLRLIQKAADGYESHSASEQMSDGTYLNVTVDDKAARKAEEEERDRKRGANRH